MEIPLLRGRGFTAQDDERTPNVAIVNQTFARKFFPNEDARPTVSRLSTANVKSRSSVSSPIPNT